MRSAVIRPITSREMPSAAVSGLSVFGSERLEMTSLPPHWPISPLTVKRSSVPLTYAQAPNRDWGADRDPEILAINENGINKAVRHVAISALECMIFPAE